jgi:hypothetical protein
LCIGTGALLVMLGSLGGCAAFCGDEKRPNIPTATGGTYVALLTEGVKIRAADGSWEIVGGGEPVPVAAAVGEPLDNPAALEQDMNLYKVAAGPTAVAVLVETPGREKPLYGVMSFRGIYDSARSSGVKRVYRVQVLPERIEQATGGRVSLSYEPYDYELSITWDHGNEAGCVRDELKEERTAAAWVLWMSDVPL